MSFPLADMTMKPLPSWSSEDTWATFVNGDFHQVIEGHEMQKSQDDIDRYERIIKVSRPDVVIETGTRNGGSALWFASQGLRVITIDMNPEGWMPGPETEIVCLRGHSSTELPSAILARIAADVQGARVMVSLDSDHHASHVVDEITAWAPYVTRGCYLVIEDACFDTWTGQRARLGGGEIPERGGPLHAINHAGPDLRRNFRRDTAVEGLSSISHSPVGWWHRFTS